MRSPHPRLLRLLLSLLILLLLFASARIGASTYENAVRAKQMQPE